ncbi:Gfo/Idh/MocA family protein [Colwellia sp. TT2012]|uniref:Gfo/Idh/MocA family protein n=1 Tax=Colwellia sp. TT2012 TaxID=1720342 RepID=UPI00070B07A3|nr:Gfo/Idh/MocA family oxidoreductase [Colwellia sp. TT2012]
MTLSIGVIGLGNISQRHRKNLKMSYPNATILAMSASGRQPNSKVENADKIVYSLEALIDEKPYFSIIASPATLHSSHAIPLIKAGIPVLIEKPVTVKSADAIALLDIAKLHNTPVAVGYCLRYLSSAPIIKQLIENKTIGYIYNASINIGQFLPHWRPTKDYRESVSANAHLGGGALLELSHELDYLQWILGDMDFHYAHLRNSTELQLDVEELADIVLVSKTGCVCNIHLDFIQKQPQRKCSFIGSKGRLDWDLLNNTITLHTLEGDKTLYSQPEWDKNKMYLDMLADFDSLINHKENQCPTLFQACKTITLIEKIKEKAVFGGTL